ncbi:MAG TPA: hypothetical protein VFB90_03480 [Dehalococcoidia bacterium]|nr:hypothetical protein [Dehalococcoidia bacterium]
MKTFALQNASSSLADLEQEMNDWLEANPDIVVEEIATAVIPTSGGLGLQPTAAIIVRYKEGPPG